MRTNGLIRLNLLLVELGIKHIDPEHLLKSDILIDFLRADPANIDRAKLRDLIGLPPVGKEFVVDYSMTLEEMVTAGHYDEFQLSHSKFDVKLFSISGFGKVSFSPKLFGHEEDMESQGFRPARIEEFLAYNSIKVFERGWVTATGSPVTTSSGEEQAVTCGYDYNERILNLYPLRSIPEFHRRLGVRK